MKIRPIREEDIEQVIQLFRANYGDDYAIPEFYDPQWVKRGVYSDHILWMVIEDDDPASLANPGRSRIVASGAAILDYGDYNDQIAEIGRLVVDPTVGGKGLGRQMLSALVDASDDRVEFAFGEARTTHSKTQRIFDRVGLAPLGFLPMTYMIQWRESWVLSGQLFNNGRSLRSAGAAQVIPQVAPIARLALRNMELNETVHVVEDARPYPLDHTLDIEPLSGSTLVRLLKVEQGRLFNPEVFGGLHLDQGLSQLKVRKATYLVASSGGEMLGAVGYVPDPSSQSVRIVELIARDEVVKGCLLRRAVEEAEQLHEAEVIECDVSANHPRIQRTLYELGFLPAGYAPGMVFHNTARWDVVKMIKLNVAWNPGPMELVESAQAMFDVVMPPFIERSAQRVRKQPARQAKIFSGLTPLELDFVQQAGAEVICAAGIPIALDGLYVVISGAIELGGTTYLAGQELGTAALLKRSSLTPAIALQDTCLFRLGLAEFDALCDNHPHVGIKLFRSLAENH